MSAEKAFAEFRTPLWEILATPLVISDDKDDVGEEDGVGKEDSEVQMVSSMLVEYGVFS